MMESAAPAPNMGLYLSFRVLLQTRGTKKGKKAKDNIRMETKTRNGPDSLAQEAIVITNHRNLISVEVMDFDLLCLRAAVGYSIVNSSQLYGVEERGSSPSETRRIVMNRQRRQATRSRNRIERWPHSSGIPEFNVPLCCARDDLREALRSDL